MYVMSGYRVRGVVDGVPFYRSRNMGTEGASSLPERAELYPTMTEAVLAAEEMNAAGWAETEWRAEIAP